MDLIDYEVTVILVDPDEVNPYPGSLVVAATNELHAAWMAGRYMADDTLGAYPVKVVVERYEPNEGDDHE